MHREGSVGGEVQSGRGTNGAHRGRQITFSLSVPRCAKV